ncbi:complement factor H-like [Lytechinus pictus]|uniref:complement factor H-like n=1 Tax=Lytechinus pictus TaxID=7653 RepID=UPI0030B9F52A
MWMWKWCSSGDRVPKWEAREAVSMSLWGSKLSLTTTVLFLSGLVLTATGQTCGTLCPPPDVLGGGTVTFSPNQTCYDEGSSVNVTCSGYLFGVTDIGECFNGYWETPQQPTCEESNCPVPTAPQKGSYSPSDSNSLYDEIEYSCDEGLFLDGPSMAVCTGTGQWSPNTTLSCSGNCTIPVITNGEGTSSDDVLQEGSQLTITCSEGYSLIGVANVTCHSEEWNPEVGECLANCPSPGVANSDFATNQEETNHGDYIILTCDEGFTSGSGENVSEPLTCVDGTWDKDLYCYANYCPSISPPDDGYANSLVEPFYHGRVVTFNCSVGFTLVGDSNSMCYDGNWTNAVPECKADCLVPYIKNSNLNDTTNSTYVPHDSSTTLTCNDGFTFEIGSDFDGILTCDDGVIDSSGIECLEYCASPTVPNSNWANRTDVYPNGRSVVVICDDGFSSGSGLLQVEILVCEGSSWNDSVYCYENCPNISPPDGGNMYPGSASFYHSNSVYFNCSENYLFVGQSNLTCDNGTWSDSVPDCKVPDTDALMIVAITCTVAVVLLVVFVIVVLICKRSRRKRADNSSSPTDALTTFRGCKDTLPPSPPENFGNQQDDHDFTIEIPTPGGTMFYEEPDSIQPSIYQTINNEVVDGGYELTIYKEDP